MRSLKKTSRVVSIVFASVVMPTLAASAMLLWPQAEAKAAETKRAECKASSVLLTKDGDGQVPKNLSFLQDVLRDDQFAAYKGFRLLETSMFKLEINKSKSEFMRATGHKLSLQFRGTAANKLKIHATLLAPKRKKPLVDTNYLSVNNGLLLIDGGRQPNGRVIFAIQCRRSST